MKPCIHTHTHTHTHTHSYAYTKTEKPAICHFLGGRTKIGMLWPDVTLITGLHLFGKGEGTNHYLLYTAVSPGRIQMEHFISCVRSRTSQERRRCNVRVFRSSIIMLCLFYWFLLASSCLESLSYKLPSYYRDMAPAQATTQLFIRCVLGSNCFLQRINNKKLWSSLMFWAFLDLSVYLHSNQVFWGKMPCVSTNSCLLDYINISRSGANISEAILHKFKGNLLCFLPSPLFFLVLVHVQ